MEHDNDGSPLLDTDTDPKKRWGKVTKSSFFCSSISFFQLFVLVLVQSFFFWMIFYYHTQSINTTPSTPPPPVVCPSLSCPSLTCPDIPTLSCPAVASAAPSSAVASPASPLALPEPTYNCGTGKSANPGNPMRSLLLTKLFSEQDPFCSFRNRFFIKADWSYPHTHVTDDYIRWVIKNTFESGLFIEAGSFKAGSAVKTAQAIRDTGFKDKAVLFCIDPFTGDTQMWLNLQNFWPWLMITDGAPRIYDQFMVNVIDRKQQDIIVPMVATSIIGFRAVERLQKEMKVLPMVDALYLDSAHEKGETLKEVEIAYRLVKDGGILYGDDWDWAAVREDITEFASTTQCGQLSMANKTLPKKCKQYDNAEGWPSRLGDKNNPINIDKFVPPALQIVLKVDPSITYGAHWFFRKIVLNDKELNEF